MKFRNIDPNGARMFPDLNDLTVEAGGVVDVPDEFGEGLLGQFDVWEFIPDPVVKAKTKQPEEGDE